MSREKQNKGIKGEKGTKGPPGVCPACGIYGNTISWDADTGVSTCTCGWSSEEGRDKQIDVIIDLLAEFDEMGFIPATTVPNPEAYAVKWREEITKALIGYRKQSEDVTDINVGNKSKWISVDERLPERFTHIIVCDENGMVGEAYHFEKGRFEWLADEECAFATHWMPLPTPPKMKGGAG